jgi:hypothetical protein
MSISFDCLKYLHGINSFRGACNGIKIDNVVFHCHGRAHVFQAPPGP